MSKKRYTNVYTILDKVKKGEIKSYYKDDKGLFGKIDFYKKPDLIKPHMHWLDENRLEHILTSYINDTAVITDIFKGFCNSADYRDKIPADKKPNFTDFCSKVQENYKKFPKHIVRDIFKMYNHKIDKLEFEERTEKNYSKYKFLEKANDSVAKIMTENSNLKSAIFARNIAAHYITRLAVMDFVDPQSSHDIKQNMESGNDFNSADVDNALNEMMESGQGKVGLKKAMQDATNLCKQMDNAMDKEVQETMFDNSNNGSAGKISPDYVKEVSRSLSKISLSMRSVKDKIKKLLDKSVSYFSARQEVQYENLFNSDNIAGLEDYELLHPKLRKIFAEDVYVKETKNVGKMDVYIDVSGSMSCSCGVDDVNGEWVSRIDFAKAFVAKLKELDMLNDVYTFNNKVKQCKTDLISISMLGTGGGTTINNAVESIQRNGVNALILTDAEDGCNIYSDKAFFIGLKDANFSHFHDGTIAEYSNKDQVVIFDGSSITKVNEKGYVVK